jgi:hypothetical protein
VGVNIANATNTSCNTGINDIDKTMEQSMEQHNFQPDLNPKTNLQSSPKPTSWLELIENGDGYLTPEQRQAFEYAISLVVERMQVTLGKASTPEEQAEQFDFSRYIESMEERFLHDAQGEDEIQQDAALTAARVIEHIGQIILSAKM